MTLAFYDKNGRPYAYSEDGEHLYTFSGAPIGYIKNGSVYSFSGHHLGYFQDGLLRDSLGDTLLFTDGAIAGPLKPIRGLRPPKALKQLCPVKGLRQLRPLRPLSSLVWSKLSPEDVFRG